jgi:peptidoglycan/LPS O-acetylase OafA/YrhL
MAQPRVLPSLTPLRGVAALWVVLYHYNDWAPNLSLNGYIPVVDRGYLAVDLFLVMSGFVMAHVYHHDFVESLSNNYVGSLVRASLGSTRCTFSFCSFSCLRRCWRALLPT